MGLYLTEYLCNDTLFGIWKIEEDEQALSQLLIPSDEQWQKLTSARRKKEYLCSRILANHLCKEAVTIDYSEDGAPELSNGWGISITHSKHLVAVVVSKTKYVAIDVEPISVRTKRLSDKFLLSAEQALLQSKQCDNEFGTTLFWSAKESLYKVSKSPIKKHYKEQLHIVRMDRNKLEGRVGKFEVYDILFRSIEEHILTMIIAEKSRTTIAPKGRTQ